MNANRRGTSSCLCAFVVVSNLMTKKAADCRRPRSEKKTVANSDRCASPEVRDRCEASAAALLRAAGDLDAHVFAAGAGHSTRDVATAWVRGANFRRGLPLRMLDPRSLDALPRRGVPIGLAVRVASRVDRHARAVERE